MPIPTVMRWDHKNSPKITDLNNWEQTKAWFQSIFVDGYLADDDTTLIPPLGWDLVADDGSKYITLTMDKDGDPNVVNRSRLVFKYKYVIENSYFGYHGKFTEHFDNLEICRFGKSGDTDHPENGHPITTGINDISRNDLVCPYVVIGTNRGVYFLGGYNGSIEESQGNAPFSTSNNYSYWSYFGDFINDGVDYGRNNQTASYQHYSEWGTSGDYRYNEIGNLSNWYTTINRSRVYCYNDDGYYNGFRIARDHNGNTRGQNFSATPFMYWIENVHLGASKRFALKYPYVDGGLKIVPHELWVRNSVTTNGNRQQVYIGKMPGLYYPLHFRPLGYDGNSKNIVEFEGSGEYEGQFFIGLARTGMDEFYINVTENWDI